MFVYYFGRDFESDTGMFKTILSTLLMTLKNLVLMRLVIESNIFIAGLSELD